MQVLPPPIARQRQAAGTRSAPIPPHCWPGPALVRASYPTSRACLLACLLFLGLLGSCARPSFRFVALLLPALAPATADCHLPDWAPVPPHTLDLNAQCLMLNARKSTAYGCNPI
jgi:hypothetical protein